LKTIHRYVLWELLPPFGLSVAILTFLLMLNKFSLLLDLVVNKKVPFADTLFLFLTLIPFILSLTIPMSMMVSTLLAFGRLSSDMEVTAFKSNGGHLFQLIAPALVFSLLLTVLMVYFNNKVLPAADYAFKIRNFQILKKQANIAIHERVFIDQFEGYQFYIDQQNSDGLFSNVKVFNRWSSRASVQTTLAQTGNLETNQNTYQIFFHMNNGVMIWDNKNFNAYNRLYFDHYTIHLKLENQLAQMADVKKDYEEMDFSELSHEIQQTTDLSRKNSMRGEFQKRLSLPFACLALTWFCAPLGLWTKSKGFLGFVLGIVMIFIYYLMFTLGEILSEQRGISPLFGLWWANMILAFAGCLIYYIVVSENAAFKSLKSHRLKRFA
jgi:lipopolysaccharide export system permease protein